MVVGLARQDLVGAVELLDQHHAGELVRERHRPERQRLVAALEPEPVGAADDEADVATRLPAILEPAGEAHRVVRPPTHVEQHAMAARRYPALHLLARAGRRRRLGVVAELDQLQPRLAGEHAPVVLEVVRERRADAADGEDRVLHRSCLNASPIPMRSIVDGWVPSRNRTTRGGSGSETFLIAMRRWKSMKSSGSRVSSSENPSARASTARESWLEIIVTTGTTRAIERATAGTVLGPGAEPRGANRSASDATAHVPNGATTASQIRPWRTSWWRTCPSSWATTSRVSAGVKSSRSVS